MFGGLNINNEECPTLTSMYLASEIDESGNINAGKNERNGEKSWEEIKIEVLTFLSLLRQLQIYFYRFFGVVRGICVNTCNILSHFQVVIFSSYAICLSHLILSLLHVVI